MKDLVEIGTGTIRIVYPNYGDDGRNYGDLFDWLSDADIITASELGENYVINCGDIYLFSHRDENELKEKGEVTLHIYGWLADYKESDKNFYNWYYGIK